jgi:vitamin B12 transporter
MGKTRITLFLALGAGLAGARAATVDAEPRPQAEASATVTVTAEALPVEVAKTPNAVTVVDRQALERRGAGSLGELLQELIPGQALASGGVGTATSVYLGGTRPQDTVVTLDGLRLTDVAGLGGVNASLIGLVGIERLEIQQGPCSARFGSDALGGAIALYSAGGPQPGFSGEARAAAGNRGLLKGSLAAAYGWDRGWVRAAVAAERQDQVMDPANRYRSVNTYLGAGRQLGEDTLVTLNYYNTFSGVPIPIVYTDYGTSPRLASQFDPRRQDFNRTEVVSGTLRSALSPDLTAELTLGQVLQQRLEPDVVTNLPTVGYLSRRNQAVGHVAWQPSSRGSLQVGLDASGETARNPDLAGNNQLSADARHLAVVVDGEREVVAGLRLVGSLRTERDRVTVPTSGSGTVEDASTQVTGKAGVNWTLPRGFRAYANAGTGFSNPLLYQSLFNANYGGEALANEKSRTAQTGLTWAAGPWKAGVELSRTLYRNLVYYDPNGGVPIPEWFGWPSGIYRNGNRIRIQSAEFKLAYETTAWGAGGFYRNQEARDLTRDPGDQLASSAVVRRPFQTLGAHAYRVIGDVRLEGRWSWTGPRYEYNGGANIAYKAHFNDLSVSAAWAARKDLTLVLRGDHLLQPDTSREQWLARTRDFQNDASQIFGYPAQPPTVSLEVRYRL